MIFNNLEIIFYYKEIVVIAFQKKIIFKENI